VELPRDMTMVDYEVMTSKRDFNDPLKELIGNVLVDALTCP
jgi:hypothetical protein